MAIEIPVHDFEMLGEKARRADMYRAVVVQLERRVEDIGSRVDELTREVDDIEIEPEYTCDCSCDGDLDEQWGMLNTHQNILEALTARLEAIEKHLGM